MVLEKRPNEVEKNWINFYLHKPFLPARSPYVQELNFSQEHCFKANLKSPLKQSLIQEQHDPLQTPIPRRVYM